MIIIFAGRALFSKENVAYDTFQVYENLKFAGKPAKN